MPWEYLDNLNYRYENAARLVDFTGKDVVDLCSGNTGLYDLVKDKVKSYRACDVRKLHPIVEEVTDDEFSKTIDRCDILCVFGYGGYEITKEKLESPTLLSSTIYLAEKFSPIIILESVSRFEPALKDFVQKYKYEEIRTVGSDWLTDRVMYILGR